MGKKEVRHKKQGTGGVVEKTHYLKNCVNSKKRGYQLHFFNFNPYTVMEPKRSQIS